VFTSKTYIPFLNDMVKIDKEYIQKGKFSGSYFYDVLKENPTKDFIYLSAANV